MAMGRGRVAKTEDRISNLPDDIIHCILSFLDMKYAIQTSILSKRWKHIWTSMPHLNLNSQTFLTLPQFAKFVKNALSHRNHSTQVSTVELRVTGAATQFCVKSIIKYAYLHNVRQMTMKCSKVHLPQGSEFLPQCLLSCHTLKHLTLDRGWVPKLGLDFPVLETLDLSNLLFLSDRRDRSLSPFSKCVNLQDLTLDRCSMLGILTVCAPRLCNLTITDPAFFPKVLNVVAPRLENLTTIVKARAWRAGFDILQLSTSGLDSLEKVDLSLSEHEYNKERFVPQVLDLFQKLRSAKCLVLDKGIIEGLWSCRDQLLHEPCPFNNLKCLKQKDRNKARMPPQLRNYFLPTATFIMDLPQPQKKISRQQQQIDKGIMAKKNKMEEEKQQIKTLSKQNRVLEAKLSALHI